MMRAFRAKGLREREARGQVREFLAQRVPPDEAVMVVVGAVPYDLMCGYLLRPRTVLFLAAGYTTEQYLTLQRNVGARWVLGVQDSPVLGQLRSLEPRPVGRLSTALGPFELHHLERTAR